MDSNIKCVDIDDSVDRFHDNKAKGLKLVQRKRNEMLDSVGKVITLLRNKPSMWTSNDFTSFRSFVYDIYI